MLMKTIRDFLLQLLISVPTIVFVVIFYLLKREIVLEVIIDNGY